MKLFFKEPARQIHKRSPGFTSFYISTRVIAGMHLSARILMYYRYSRKWIELFNREPLMITVETGHYIKGMHNLLTANFNLRNFKQFDNYLYRFERFTFSKVANYHDNFRMQAFVYLTSAKINQHLMKGSFEEGVKLVTEIEKGLDEFSLYIDRHRVLVIHYKTALLYFGNGDYEASIDHLQKIINGPVDIRIDLQCYARLLHLMAHFELGNDAIIESL